MQVHINHSLIELVQGDITQQHTDAIVNAANSSLLGGGGVDGAIHRAGGPSILEECRTLGGCPTGEARITSGGNLSARYVIHTVGPIYRDYSPVEAQSLLERAYRNSLKLAVQHHIRSITFPSISTGAYGYPVSKAAPAVLRVIRDFLQEPEGAAIEVVRFVLFDIQTYAGYRQALDALMGEVYKERE